MRVEQWEREEKGVGEQEALWPLCTPPPCCLLLNTTGSAQTSLHIPPDYAASSHLSPPSKSTPNTSTLKKTSKADLHSVLVQTPCNFILSSYQSAGILTVLKIFWKSTKVFIFNTEKGTPSCLQTILLFKSQQKYFLFLKILFIFRERKREGERERKINVWLPLVHPLVGTWPTTQACALTGTQSVTLWFAGQHSVHWATPARLVCFIMLHFESFFKIY